MTSILVTGASGFIGRHLIPRLSQASHEIVHAHHASGDVAEERTWLSFPRAEVVVHLAGKSFVPESWLHAQAFVTCNVAGTIGALEYCNRQNARLIFLSSYLYGTPEKLPISERTPLVATNPYALSKKLAEEACQFYSDKLGVSITILRLFNVYGRGQPDSFLIPSILQQIGGGDAIGVKDLEPKRDYVYVRDVVEAILKAVNCRSGLNVFNIGSGVSHSVREVIQVIQSIKKTNLPVRSSEQRRRDEIMETVADISEAKLRLRWVPEWTLRQGLEDMLSD